MLARQTVLESIPLGLEITRLLALGRGLRFHCSELARQMVTGGRALLGKAALKARPLGCKIADHHASTPKYSPFLLRTPAFEVPYSTRPSIPREPKLPVAGVVM